MNKIRISAVIILIAITILSLLPPKSGIELPSNDKLSHFLAYGILSLNVCLLFRSRSKMLIALICTIAYGILMEFAQSLVPGRDPSFHDILANTTGVLIGFLLNLLIGSWFHRKFVK
jgi:VanZ family protein